MAILVRTALVVALVLAVPAAVWVYGMVDRPTPTRRRTPVSRPCSSR